MFKNFVVKPTERLIVLLDGSLHTVLNAGKHTIWHCGKEIETHKQDATVLHVQWNGIGSLLKIASERKKAEKFLQIVHNPAGHNTLVWHDEMPVFTMTDNTDYWAFFRPEKSELNTLTLAHNEYWLPENVQETLLLRNQVPSNCEKFVVEQHERLLIRINGRLQRVLGEGRYLLQSKARAKNNEIEIERQHTANAMYHQWEDAQKWAKEQPETRNGWCWKALWGKTRWRGIRISAQRSWQAANTQRFGCLKMGKSKRTCSRKPNTGCPKMCRLLCWHTPRWTNPCKNIPLKPTNAC